MKHPLCTRLIVTLSGLFSALGVGPVGSCADTEDRVALRLEPIGSKGTSAPEAKR